VTPCTATRVTRLGEYLPVGWLFTLEEFFLNSGSKPNFGCFYYKKVTFMYISITMGLGHILGDFLTNSSGHPDRHNVFCQDPLLICSSRHAHIWMLFLLPPHANLFPFFCVCIFFHLLCSPFNFNFAGHLERLRTYVFCSKMRFQYFFPKNTKVTSFVMRSKYKIRLEAPSEHRRSCLFNRT
jgi:hypothetical protein